MGSGAFLYKTAPQMSAFTARVGRLTRGAPSCRHMNTRASMNNPFNALGACQPNGQTIMMPEPMY
jgi:hypothetical protein